MKVFGVVYLIWNMVNGKKYVGQTVKTVKARFNEHARQNGIIGRAIRKYGKENFRYGVIKSCDSKAEMDTWEKFFIAALKSKKPKGYNQTDGGGGIAGCTDETRAKLSAKGKGVKRTVEYCAKLSWANRSDSPFKNLQNEMDKRNLTRASLSKLLGFAANTLSCKMLGQRHFADKDIKTLVEIFNLPAEYLMTRTDGLSTTILKSEICAKISAKKRGYSPFKNLLNEISNRKLSYAAIAKLLGVSPQVVSDKMHAKQNFTESQVAKLSEIFGKPIEYLMYKEGFL